MSILQKIKYPSIEKDIYKKKIILDIDDDIKKREIQLYKLNYIWSYCYNNLEFYRNIKINNKIPNSFESLDDFKHFPYLTKDIINNNLDLIVKDLDNFKFTYSGGTSGEITKFPTSYINSRSNYINTIICRSWHNLDVTDKTLYIWGHSHKFSGNYIQKIFRNILNNLKDSYHNRYRVSAYNLSEKNLDFIQSIINKKNFKVILSYGSSLSILANYLKEKKFCYKKDINLIFTSENLSVECENNLKDVFPKGKIISEFGMAETGVIGYSEMDFKKIRLIWSDFLIQNYENSLCLTDLSYKPFPLIKYFPDDYLGNEDEKIYVETIYTLENLIGKQRETFEFISNTKKYHYSLIVLDHIFKKFDSLYSVQFFIKNNFLYIIYFGNLDELEAMQNINNYFNDKIKNIKFKKTNKPIKTVAGKFKFLIDEKDFNNL